MAPAPNETQGNTSQISSSAAFWQHKPWWCQPWSILSTGGAGIGGGLLAYRKLHAPLWLVVPFLIGILIWWFLFLVLVPSKEASLKP